MNRSIKVCGKNALLVSLLTCSVLRYESYLQARPALNSLAASAIPGQARNGLAASARIAAPARSIVSEPLQAFVAVASVCTSATPCASASPPAPAPTPTPTPSSTSGSGMAGMAGMSSSSSNSSATPTATSPASRSRLWLIAFSFIVIAAAGALYFRTWLMSMAQSRPMLLLKWLVGVALAMFALFSLVVVVLDKLFH